jgi:dipeptidyl aminopeptidase/acylaminoacyl peptidase
VDTGTRVVRARIPRRTAWAIGAALAVTSVVAAAWIASGRDGSSPALTAPAPARVALVYAKPPGHDLRARREVIFVASPENDAPRRLAVGTSPLLSPDGNWVVYAGSPGTDAADVRLINTAGGTPRRVGISGEPLAWSGNSRFLAVQTLSGLMIVDARTLRTSPLRLPEGSGNVSFSPDGSVLAFQHSTGAGSDIYTVARTGGRIHRLTGGHRTGFPLWGPAGIAFERFGSDRCMNCRGDVWVMDADGGNPHQLTHTHAGIYPAAWSADGRRLLAAYPATNNGKLYAVDVDSGAARALTGFVGDLYAQGLSRDGRTVLAAIGCGEIASPYGIIETIPFAGGAPSVVVRGPCRASSNF